MTQDIGVQIIEKAKSLGASSAGIASVEQIKKSPSYTFNVKIGEGINGVSANEGYTNYTVQWPEDAKSALVIALSHPTDKPELDWWSESKYGTPGNLRLHELNLELSILIKEKYGINTHRVPYGPWDNGIFLKDSAVLSGLGCIGKNNLLITPEFGPRFRLRAMLLDSELAPTGPISFDPCNDCDELCHKACPGQVFDEIAIVSDKMGMDVLPARYGNYSIVKCSSHSSIYVKESDIDFRDGLFWSEASWDEAEGAFQKDKYLKTCRDCEFSCPIGE